MVGADLGCTQARWNEDKLLVRGRGVGTCAVLWGGHAGGSGGDGGSSDQQAGNGSTPACLLT